MINSLRLSEEEKKLINKKCIEINKIYVKNGKLPIKESEFLHKILELSITYAEINKEGELFLSI